MSESYNVWFHNSYLVITSLWHSQMIHSSTHSDMCKIFTLSLYWVQWWRRDRDPIGVLSLQTPQFFFIMPAPYVLCSLFRLVRCEITVWYPTLEKSKTERRDRFGANLAINPNCISIFYSSKQFYTGTIWKDQLPLALGMFCLNIRPFPWIRYRILSFFVDR